MLNGNESELGFGGDACAGRFVGFREVHVTSFEGQDRRLPANEAQPTARAAPSDVATGVGHPEYGIVLGRTSP
jgi:hypothetical protein